MLTLGLCNDETSSACIFRDGKLIAAVSEERFTRVKMDSSFPAKSIEFVLNEAGIQLHQIDEVAYAWSKGFPQDALSIYAKRASEISDFGDEQSQLLFLERIKVEIERDAVKRKEFKRWVAEKDIKNYKIFYHHEAHALSAGFLSPFDKCVCLTADGRGDFESITAWEFDRTNPDPLKRLYSSTSCDSLGFFYGRITGLLGFKPCRHEGKITGLAANGDPRKAIHLMQKMIDFHEGCIKSNLSEYYKPFYTGFSDKLVEEVSNYSKEDIAAAAQQHLEDLLVQLTESIYEKYSLPNMPLAVAGGVFGNVKANQSLKELTCVTSMFVQPQMGDGGLCLGAAAGSQHMSNKQVKPLKNLYLGPSLGDISIKKLSKEFPSLEFIKPDNLVESIIAELKDSKVVGLARGRMEFGPRALCHRSIIYKSSDKKANDWLNKRMNRTEFMPFAPVMTVDQAKQAFESFSDDDITLKFMTSTMKTNDYFAQKCPAVNHIDNTARPQIVTMTEDPFMHSLLSRWEEVSGEIALINTSFNAHEEPIVCDVKDVLDSLRTKMVDMIVLEDLIVKSK